MPRSDRHPVITKPLPSARFALFVVLLLAAAVALVYLGFLRPPNALLGPPIQQNSYENELNGPKPKPPVLHPVLPPETTPAGGNSATTAPPDVSTAHAPSAHAAPSPAPAHPQVSHGAAHPADHGN